LLVQQILVVVVVVVALAQIHQLAALLAVREL
jgi:hypothetical protein